MRRSLIYLLSILTLFHALGNGYGTPVNTTKNALLASTATIYSTETEVCAGDSVEATIFFTGDGPWDVKVNDKDGTILDLKDVAEETITIWLVPLEDNRYYIREVRDRRGKRGDTFGEVILSVYEPMPVSIQLEKTAYLDNDPGVALASNPSGGVFSGEGIAGNVFYPQIAGAEGSPHRITCSYTSPYGCVAYDYIDIHVLYGEGEVQLLSGNEIITSLCDDGDTYSIRGSNMDNIPGSFELRRAGSSDPLPGHISDDNLKDDMAILDPSGLGGDYDIIYTYGFQDLTVSIPYRFRVHDLGAVEITGLPDVVCKSDDPYLLIPETTEADPGDTYEFSGPGVSGNQADGYYFDPGSPEVPVGENQIALTYYAANGCTHRLNFLVINKNAPNVQFFLDPVCLSEDGSIVNFLNFTEGKEGVDSWSWDFGDPLSGANNYSNDENPSHFYNEAGSRQISLSATTGDGCVAVFIVDTILAKRPIADFSWINDCYTEGKKVAFVDQSLSPLASIDTFTWTFKSMSNEVLGVIGSSSTEDTVEFLFPSQDDFIIDLQIRNEVGCVDQASKEITLNPIRKLSATGYLENFNGEDTDWRSGTTGQELSWIRDEPDFSGFNQVPGDLAWFTSLPPDNSDYLEHSWIQSPCIDFTSRNSPFIQMDLMKSFTPGIDGAVLQYQDVVSEGWKTIGVVGSGINWYNAGNLSNNPGGSNFGWGLNQFTPDTEWISASHGLGIAAGKSHVKLRVLIATGGSKEIDSGRYNQGFAFDNIFIGETIRRSLLEHFTNSSIVEGWNADDVVDRFALNHPASVIDLQYHMDYPGVDPMNENNPYPPSTRAFNYGVQGVPYAILNGGTIADHRFDFSDSSQEPNGDALQQAAQEVPVFDVDLTVQWMENRVEVNTLVTCKADTFNSNLQLYVALVESSVTSLPGLNGDTIFRNVVLDILPSPAGKLLGNEWFNGKTDTRTYSWNYAPYVEDIEELAVVVFVQDRDQGEVLQVASNYLTPLVSKETVRYEAGSLTVYPNPAMDHLYVNLGNRQVTSGRLEIVDISGKAVVSADVLPGKSLYQLDVAHLSRGMYIVYWMEAGEIRGRKKVVLTP